MSVAFGSSFLPPQAPARQAPCSCPTQNGHEIRSLPLASLRQTSSHSLCAIAATFASLSLFLRPTPTRAFTSESPTGTLLQIQSPEGSNTKLPSHGHSSRSSSTSTHAPTPLPAVSVRRMIPSGERMMRGRVRPALVVGVGALTGGSVVLHKRASKGKPESTERGCAVVCLHIPFCVRERSTMVEKLERLGEDTCLMTPDGMASAARRAATVLLGENGLLEDSTKFSPHLETFIAENIDEAEKRFNAHVETESHRLKAIEERKRVGDVKKDNKLGEYGVVTLVVATTEGVDLACHNCSETIIRRLRRAVSTIAEVREGDVVGLELRWVPEEGGRTLTRRALAQNYPALRL